jgi:hypothetical protein
MSAVGSSFAGQPLSKSFPLFHQWKREIFHVFFGGYLLTQIHLTLLPSTGSFGQLLVLLAVSKLELPKTI